MNVPLVVGTDTLPPAEVQRYLTAALGFTSRGGQVFCSYDLLGHESDRVFVATVCEELIQGADSLEHGSGSGGPVALVVDTLASPARIVGHEVPGDGNQYGRDLRRIFPAPVQRQIELDAAAHNRRAEALRTANRSIAGVYFTGRRELAAERSCVDVAPDSWPAGQTVRVYYACEVAGAVPGQLYPAARPRAAGMSPVEAAIRELVKGPTPEERAGGFRSHLSEQTANAVRSVTLSPQADTVTIDLVADLPQRLPSTPDALSFLPPGVPAEITWTVFQQFPEVRALRLLLGGDEATFWRWLGGAPRIFTRGDWERI